MKTRSDAGEVIAFRTFDRADGTVELRFYKPYSDPKPGVDADTNDPPWRCEYAISFPDGEIKRSYAIGVDGIQALLLAFAGASGTLRYVGDGTSTRRPPLHWLGDDDLGLSINHFE